MSMIICLLAVYAFGWFLIIASDYMASDYPCIEVKRANEKMIKDYGRVLSNEEILGINK